MIPASEDIFETISLEEMDQVKLMNRVDRKFWFHASELSGLLESVRHSYFILAIEGRKRSVYSTIYFDTADNGMYTSHHNGKLNRMKIRYRTYVETGIKFLEVKYKTNRGRTIKKRILTGSDSASFSPREREFIQSNTGFQCDDLHPWLVNRFSRITLINKEMNERCTIDTDIQFLKGDKIIPLHNLVVVEVKSEARSRTSPLTNALQEKRIRPSGFSKYCVGRVVVDPTLKQNAFKKKIRRIDKHILTQAS